ncbi:hypothetical protein BDV37DRAFT_257288 [Aspergillus pseudonomiae]|uniref:Uncharacterized protein n=1 Tax=Aspergillus pseudonomiae TaxID=1506151 RepID=A0A5N7D2I2_9EURO|nr:uncharacterized protein BDV37DRAFT_257288 [Aspergillus pseudonomiae]KAE8400610.1 hypothetical protein BDV37DRAFT_257288 [Aspergillus pseudonomiae]
MVQEKYQSLGSNNPIADPRSPAATAEYENYYREFPNELVNSIRNEDQAMVARIVGLIQSGASQDKVLGAIRSANS